MGINVFSSGNWHFLISNNLYSVIYTLFAKIQVICENCVIYYMILLNISNISFFNLKYENVFTYYIFWIKTFPIITYDCEYEY